MPSHVDLTKEEEARLLDGDVGKDATRKDRENTFETFDKFVKTEAKKDDSGNEDMNTEKLLAAGEKEKFGNYFIKYFHTMEVEKKVIN